MPHEIKEISNLLHLDITFAGKKREEKKREVHSSNINKKEKKLNT